MTLSDVFRQFRYWQKHPPPTELLSACAQALGVKLPSHGKSAKQKPLTAEEAVRMLQVTGGRITPDMVGD